MNTIEIITHDNESFDIFVHTNFMGEDLVNEFESIIMQQLGNNYNKVVVHLQEVTYMSSAGLALLVKLLTKVTLQSGTLYLKGVKKSVENLLVLTHLDGAFKII